ncbi:MAG: cupin domain-containing protein [Deltaproteobacteria bacterium]|jgi:uncharacterized cupin superfamily protein|nr:cupin domain-containing protein [Deltaproteobacteria bacterium]
MARGTKVASEKRLDPRKRRHARKHEVFQIEDVPRVEWSAGDKYGGVVRALGEFGRSERVGVVLEEVMPGRWSSTFHWHTQEEEHVWVLEGTGVMRIGEREVPVRGGSYVVFPPNGRVAHATRNTGKKPLRILVIGTREPNDACVYPDSEKVLVRALGKVGRLVPAGYWDGEL